MKQCGPKNYLLVDRDTPLPQGDHYSALSLVFSTNVVCVKTQQKNMPVSIE